MRFDVRVSTYRPGDFPRRSPAAGREPVEDGVLVAAIARHDEAAFEEALRRHRAPVIAFARRIVQEDARAEEVAQEVFLRLWRHPDRFDAPRGSLRSYLLAQTHGRAIDMVRSDVSRTRRELRDARLVSHTSPSAAEEAIANTVTDSIRAALDTLPTVERRAIELAYFGDHSYRDVARLLGTPEGTIKSRIRSGMSKLRVALRAQELAASGTAE